MGLIRSWRKSVKLLKISKQLGAKRTATDIAADAINRAAIDSTSKRDVALSQLFDLVENDPDLRKVMQVCGASRDSLDEAYSMMCAIGGGQWVSGHWVPASAFAFGPTLHFVLSELKSCTPDHAQMVVLRLISYFQNGEVGPVR